MAICWPFLTVPPFATIAQQLICICLLASQTVEELPLDLPGFKYKESTLSETGLGHRGTLMLPYIALHPAMILPLILALMMSQL